MVSKQVGTWNSPRFVVAKQLNRRAKIKLLAKKSIETGEDCDAIPESMRTYLANQALESGKPLGRDFLGRSPSMTPYGSGGMMLNPDSSHPGKIGQFGNHCVVFTALTLRISHSPFHLQVAHHRHMATCRSERHGPGRFLCPR